MKPPPPTMLDVDLDELLAIIERAALSATDREKLRAAIDTLALVTQELEAKHTSLGRLRKMLFGAPTEKTSALGGHRGGERDGSSPAEAAAQSGGQAAAESGAAPAGAIAPAVKPKRKGHGRNGAARYPGAEQIRVAHPSLCPGACCPACQDGKLYALRRPAVLVRVRGQAPMAATVYELELLRCSPCGEVFAAPAPDGVGEDKYDESVAAMIALVRYGSGTPFNRVERLQSAVGVPLPTTTQWDLVHGAANGSIGVAHAELVRQAAQGELVHNDDTTAKILQLMGKRREREPAGDGASKRTGIFTTSIVSVHQDRHIALFFTGPKHAGENLSELLAKRSSELSAPIQMCDALSRNMPKALKTIVANCLAHGRRQFVEIYDRFPTECLHVLETLRDVYRNDEVAREQKMTGQERLKWHQRESGSLMSDLKTWLEAELGEKRVEPNSALGEAMSYLLNHWHALTQFLRVAGAPLDNNICERALKRAILHRKNSLFFKTLNGARVGDIFMSLIHTAELCGANPFDYLVTLQRHDAEVRAAPAEWMPWNYAATRARLALAA